MRPILTDDLDAAARALMAVPPAMRPALCVELIQRADIADRYRKRLGRAHPTYGTGSLMAAALREAHAANGRGPCDADYCICLALVLNALADRRRAGKSRAGNADVVRRRG